MTRDEAIAELKTRYLTMSQCLDKEELHKANEAIDMAIEVLQTEHRTGKWKVVKVLPGEWEGMKKYACDKCGEKVGIYISRYCPNCGAKMEEDLNGNE